MTASKLEYADDVGLLDWTAAEASERVSELASGSRESASMEMSAPKSKGRGLCMSGSMMAEKAHTDVSNNEAMRCTMRRCDGR